MSGVRQDEGHEVCLKGKTCLIHWRWGQRGREAAGRGLLHMCGQDSGIGLGGVEGEVKIIS